MTELFSFAGKRNGEVNKSGTFLESGLAKAPPTGPPLMTGWLNTWSALMGLGCAILLLPFLAGADGQSDYRGVPVSSRESLIEVLKQASTTRDERNRAYSLLSQDCRGRAYSGDEESDESWAACLGPVYELAHSVGVTHFRFVRDTAFLAQHFEDESRIDSAKDLWSRFVRLTALDEPSRWGLLRFQALTTLARYHFESGDWTQAINYDAQAIRSSPWGAGSTTTIMIEVQIAKAQSAAGDYGSAIHILSDAIAKLDNSGEPVLGSEYVDTLLAYADALEALGYIEDSQRVRARAAEVNASELLPR